MPAGLNQQVAGFTPDQYKALYGIANVTPQVRNLTGLGTNTLGKFASGQMYNNPYLQSYYNQAAAPMVQNYLNATAPSIQANAEQTGSFGGTGMQNAMQQSQFGLGQGLATPGANIFEPAYQQAQQLQYGAGQALPGAAMSMYQPLGALYGAGAAQQQQAQQQMNTGYQNQLSAAQWPFALMSEYGQGLGMALGTGGISSAMQPVLGGSKL